MNRSPFRVAAVVHHLGESAEVGPKRYQRIWFSGKTMQIPCSKSATRLDGSVANSPRLNRENSTPERATEIVVVSGITSSTPPSKHIPTLNDRDDNEKLWPRTNADSTPSSPFHW